MHNFLLQYRVEFGIIRNIDKNKFMMVNLYQIG